jgi:AraC-like DNA-binding protein
MKISIKYDMNVICMTVLSEQLEKTGADYEILDIGEVSLKQPLSGEQMEVFQDNLRKYGIEIIDDQKAQLIQKIKNAIIEMINMENPPASKISHYLADKLNMNYSYISNIFSETTFMSIESFIILQKIEKTKELLLQDLTMTEISYKLNYSSPAHLSGQFKKTTGMSPSTFKKIIETRKQKLQSK